MKAKRKREAPPGCSACKGSGRVIIAYKAGGFDTEAADFCICPRGVWLQQQERKRKAARPTG